MPIIAKNLDQAEAVSLLETLRSEVEVLHKAASLSGHAVGPIPAGGDDVLANLEALSHYADGLKMTLAPQPARVAAPTHKAKPVSAPEAQTDLSRLTATEFCQSLLNQRLLAGAPEQAQMDAINSDPSLSATEKCRRINALRRKTMDERLAASSTVDHSKLSWTDKCKAELGLPIA